MFMLCHGGGRWRKEKKEVATWRYCMKQEEGQQQELQELQELPEEQPSRRSCRDGQSSTCSGGTNSYGPAGAARAAEQQQQSGWDGPCPVWDGQKWHQNGIQCGRPSKPCTLGLAYGTYSYRLGGAGEAGATGAAGTAGAVGATGAAAGAVPHGRITVVEPGDLNYATDGVPWSVCSRCKVFRPFASLYAKSCASVLGVECTYDESDGKAQQQEPYGRVLPVPLGMTEEGMVADLDAQYSDHSQVL